VRLGVEVHNGVRASLQCGYMARQHLSYEVDYYSGSFPGAYPEYLEDDRLTVRGTTGYAWAECSGRWAVLPPVPMGK